MIRAELRRQVIKTYRTPNLDIHPQQQAKLQRFARHRAKTQTLPTGNNYLFYYFSSSGTVDSLPPHHLFTKKRWVSKYDTATPQDHFRLSRKKRKLGQGKLVRIILRCGCQRRRHSRDRGAVRCENIDACRVSRKISSELRLDGRSQSVHVRRCARREGNSKRLSNVTSGGSLIKTVRNLFRCGFQISRRIFDDRLGLCVGAGRCMHGTIRSNETRILAPILARVAVRSASTSVAAPGGNETRSAEPISTPVRRSVAPTPSRRPEGQNGTEPLPLWHPNKSTDLR